MILAHRIRLLYVVYNENLVGSGILRTQVREMLIRLAALDRVEDVQLQSFISPRLWLRERHNFNALKDDLAKRNISLHVNLMPAAIAWGWIVLPLITIFCLPVLILRAIQTGPTVIHCRVLAAGWMGLLTGRLLHIPVVFDPRGPVPSEMAQNDIWPEGRLSYKVWKRIEDILIDRCEATIGVTPDYRDEYAGRGSRGANFVPNRCNNQLFRPSDERACEYNPPVVVFTGEMDSVWYSPEYIARHFLNLLRFIPQLKLLLVTRKNGAFVRDGMRRAGVPDELWDLKGVVPEKVPEVLALGSFGMVVQDTTNVWPVKFAEYLAAGLPVILNRRAGGHLTGIVSRHRLGILIDIEEPESYRGILDLQADFKAYRGRCIAFAVRKLDIGSTALQHRRIYRQLMSQT